MIKVAENFWYAPINKNANDSYYRKLFTHPADINEIFAKNQYLSSATLYKNALILRAGPPTGFTQDQDALIDLDYYFPLPDLKLIERLYELNHDKLKHLINWYIGQDASNLEEIRTHLMAKILGQNESYNYS